MQAVIRTVGGGELAQAAAEGMMSVELRRAQDELARQALELAEARAALEDYEALRQEVGALRAENDKLRVQVEMLRYGEDRYLREKMSRIDAVVNRPSRKPSLGVRIVAAAGMMIAMVRGEDLGGKRQHW